LVATCNAKASNPVQWIGVFVGLLKHATWIKSTVLATLRGKSYLSVTMMRYTIHLPPSIYLDMIYGVWYISHMMWSYVVVKKCRSIIV